MNSDNKNAIIGMVLIVIILVVSQYLSAPSKMQLEEQKRVQDSTVLAMRNDSLMKLKTVNQTQVVAVPDSIQKMQAANKFGSLANLSNGQEQISTLENAVFKVTFSNKGGRIKDVLLKNHYKISEDSNRVEKKELLHIFEDVKNRFEYLIPTTTAQGKISTEDLYFTPSVSGNTLVYRADAGNGTTLEQKYVIGGAYDIDYDVKFAGLGSIINPSAQTVQLNVDNHLDKLELNHTYERSYSFVYYREANETPNNLGSSDVATLELNKKPVQWISQSNQFFNTSIIGVSANFKSALLENYNYTDQSSDLKRLVSKLELPLSNGNVDMKMKLYMGPNDYSALRAYGYKLEDVVAYGGSILGTINRWIIRPIFDFLHGIFGNVAVCILLLTLIVKSLLYPLSYKGLKSAAKTNALKPELEKMKIRLKGDQQAIQAEQMKLYGEFGVNPLGGCLPQLLQMPIWMALFRFFPASIDFRQQGFLWAKDLTGFEEFIRLPFHIPLYGGHISLFALLWGVSLVAFTYYSMKDVDMSGQPAIMKQLQYMTPILFTVMFNSYAAALSLYMLFSNILNIGQTIVTKEYVIDHAAIRKELEEQKKKPKKTTGFRAKLEEAMKQQQQVKAEQDKKKK